MTAVLNYNGAACMLNKINNENTSFLELRYILLMINFFLFWQ